MPRLFDKLWRRNRESDDEPQAQYSPPERAPSPEATTAFNVRDTVEARGSDQAGAIAFADAQRRPLPGSFVVPDGTYGTVKGVDMNDIFVAFPVEVPKGAWRHARKDEGPEFDVGDRLKSTAPVDTAYGMIPKGHVVNVLGDEGDTLRVSLMLMFKKADWWNRNPGDLRAWGCKASVARDPRQPERFTHEAGRLQDAKEKYPKYADQIDIIAEAVPEKYLPWAVKHIVEFLDELPPDLRENGLRAVLGAVGPALHNFDRVKQHLDIKDVYQYPTTGQLVDAVTRVDRSMSPSRKVRQKAKAEAEVVYRDADTRVIRIDGHAACRFYGRGTKWCITSPDSSYWDDHSRDGYFYFIVHPKWEAEGWAEVDQILAQVPDDNPDISDARYFAQSRDWDRLSKYAGSLSQKLRPALQKIRFSKVAVLTYPTAEGSPRLAWDVFDHQVPVDQVPDIDKIPSRHGRTASPKKVEHLKKQHPNAEKVIDYLAANDPTAPKYEALPVMWNALKEFRPARVASLTQLFYASQPYAEWLKRLLPEDSPPANSVAEWFEYGAWYQERVLRERVKKFLPALRGVRNLSKVFDDPEVASYARREAERTIVSSDAWGVAGKRLVNLMSGVPRTEDKEDQKSAIKQTLRLIEDNRMLINRFKPNSLEELQRLVEEHASGPAPKGERPEGAIDLGHGVTEYTSHAAARRECSKQTNWCWTYAAPTYFDTYTARGRLFRVDIPSAPRSPFGVAVTNERITEIKNRNNKPVGSHAEKAVKKRLLEVGVIKEQPRQEPEQRTPEELQWEAAGFNIRDFAPRWPAVPPAVHLEEAIDFANHGYTPQETLEWVRVWRAAGNPGLEQFAQIKEHPLFSDLRALMAAFDQTGVLRARRLRLLVQALPDLSVEEAETYAAVLVNTPRYKDPMPPDYVKAHQSHLREAHARGYLNALLYHWGYGEIDSIPDTVERLRAFKFPGDALSAMGRGRGSSLLNQIYDYLVERGVPDALATKYANKIDLYFGSFEGAQRKIRPAVDAMVQTRVFFPDKVPIPGVAPLILKYPRELKRLFKLLPNWAPGNSTPEGIETAVQWLPYLEQRLVPPSTVLHKILYSEAPPEDPEVLLREARHKGDDAPRGSLSLFGLPVAVEYFEGEERPPFNRVCPGHYGYFEGTQAIDGDSVDVLLGPNWQDEEPTVWVIEQLDPEGQGRTQQYKVLVGWDSEDAARAAFLDMWPRHMLGDTDEVVDITEFRDAWMPKLNATPEVRE